GAPADGAALVPLGVCAHERDRRGDLPGAGDVRPGRQVHPEQVRRAVDATRAGAPTARPGVTEVEPGAIDAPPLAAGPTDEEHAGPVGRDVRLEPPGEVLAQRLAVEDVAPPSSGDLQEHPGLLVRGGAGLRFVRG